MQPPDSCPAGPSVPPEADRERRFCLALFLAALVLNVWFSAAGWNHSLLEAHEFRQTQTALTARSIQEVGWQLAYPLPLFGPPWSAPFEFPFYQAMVAGLSSLANLPLEQAGRAVSLAFFYLSLPALFLLQELLPIPAARRWLFPGLVLLSPVYLYYSRTFMIESVALCASAWFLLAFARAMHRPGWFWVTGAVLSGLAAGLAKSTTFLVFLAAAGILTLSMLLRPRDGSRPRFALLARAAALVLPAVVAVMAWTQYTDTIKAANPLSRPFVSGQLSEFLFGLSGLRLEPSFWRKILERTMVTVLDSPNFVLLLVFGLILCRQRRGTMGTLLLCFVAGPLVFANLYAVHDYYFYTSGVFALAALAVAWSNLLDLPGIPLPARCAVIALSLALQVVSYLGTYRQIQHRPTPPPPELAAVLREVTRPGDILLVIGQDWNPILPYYAGRRAIMVTDESANHPERLDAVLRSLPPEQRVTAMVIAGEHRKYPAVIGPLARRLDLQADPVLMDADTHLYLRTQYVGEAMVRIGRMPLKTFNLIDNSVENLNMPRHRYPAASLADPRIRQILGAALKEIVHPFNLAVHEVDGRPVLDAHAPTDLIYSLAPGRTELLMEFGILPGAWQNERPTDGIEFRVELVSDLGRTQVLLSRFVQPVEQPSDRRAQRVTVPLPAQAAGELRLRTLPGPANSIACDWAYWVKVEIH